MPSRKEVLTALKTVGEYCNERECKNCIFKSSDNCLLTLCEAPCFDTLADELKKQMEGDI